MNQAVKVKNAVQNLLPCGRPAPVKKKPVERLAFRVNDLVNQLNTYCLEKKLNRSEAREKLLELIIAQKRHFTALDLLNELQRKFPEIGKATLYRNLPVLVESGLLKEGPTDNQGHTLYELSGGDHHDHIVCLDCRQIFEFHDETIEKRQDQVSENLNFTPRDHHHVIYAACNYQSKK